MTDTTALNVGRLHPTVPLATLTRPNGAPVWITQAGLGWSVLTLWECEVRDAEALKVRLQSFLQTRPPHG
jgi:hypothetical protein